MHVTNVRLGFATNSSSSHSIVLNPTLDKDWGDPGDAYGREDFLLRSVPAKQRYLATQFAVNLTQQGLPTEYAWHITNGLLGSSILDMNDCDYYGVDHSSILCLPLEYKQKYSRSRKLSFDFFQDLLAYVSRPEIGISGGDDEGGKSDPGGKQVLTEIPTDYNQPFIARKDGEHWTLFSPENGTKIRLSFTTDEPYTHATQPELVDLKITDFCPYGCDFCYQSSGLSGTHADFDTVDKILRWLAERQVFEVALGGGETTMHPQFAGILERASKWYGLTPNFSTFSTDWIDVPKTEQAVLKYCGGVALSCTEWKPERIDKFARWVKDHSWQQRAQAQIVIGLTGTWGLCALIKHLKESGIRQVTLLGYKSFGRGAGQKIKRVDMLKVIECAIENRITLGLDTQAVQNYGAALDEAGISSLLRTEHEGRFSCYVDAVERRIARDSYTVDGHDFHVNWRRGEDQRFDKVLDRVFPFGV